MVILPEIPNAFPQAKPGLAGDNTESTVNIAPFGWTTNDVTSVRDIITYVQTALTAATTATNAALSASASVDRVEQLDGQYQAKLIDIDTKYDAMVILSNNVAVTNSQLINYVSTTKSYMDQTQVYYNSVEGLRDDVLTYAMQSIYKYSDSGDSGGVGTITIQIADGSVQHFRLITANTTFVMGAITDPGNTCRQLTVMLEQGTGANKVTWPSNVRWNNNRNPTLSFVQGKMDFMTLFTKNSGATWYGFYNGGWFNA